MTFYQIFVDFFFASSNSHHILGIGKFLITLPESFLIFLKNPIISINLSVFKLITYLLFIDLSIEFC